MNLLKIYDAGFVKRYHTKKTNYNQTVADHSWGVCIVLMWMYYPDLPPAKSFQWALTHDVPEAVTGDVPAPAKWRSDALRAALAELETVVSMEYGVQLPEDDQAIRFADNAELTLHCIAQLSMGNWNFMHTARKGLSMVQALPLPEHLRARGDEMIALLKQLVLEHERV